MVLDESASIGGDESKGTDTWSMSLYDQLTSSDGRINQLRFLLLIQVLAVPLGLISFVSAFFGALVVLPLLFIWYSLVVKRLQDTGRGDGWITYAQIGVGLNIIYGLSPEGSEIEIGFMGIFVTLVMLPLGIVCLFYRGDSGPNKFGPDPLGNILESAAFKAGPVA